MQTARIPRGIRPISSMTTYHTNLLHVSRITYHVSRITYCSSYEEYIRYIFLFCRVVFNNIKPDEGTPYTNSHYYSYEVQVEPEMALQADVLYDEADAGRRRVVGLFLAASAAFNDCSIRQLDGSSKLSEKKNWGCESKGISLPHIEIDSFAPGSFVDRLVMVSYVMRDGVLHKYSQDAPARNYTMFHEPLLEWIVEPDEQSRGEDKWAVGRHASRR